MAVVMDDELKDLSEKIVMYFRCRGMNKEAYDIYKTITEKYKASPKLAYEYTIISYYNDIENINDEYVLCLNEYPQETDNLTRNFKFYIDTLTHEREIDFSCKDRRTSDPESVSFSSSSPSILPYEDGYIMNVRFVNYTIINNNIYVYSTPEQYPISFNKKFILSKEFKVLDFFRSMDNIEDVRIFRCSTGSENGKIIFSGSYCGHCDGQWTVHTCTGDYISEETPGSSNGDMLMGFDLMTTVKNEACEKNWCYTYYHNELYLVYKWHPLTLGKINRNDKRITSTIAGDKICYMLDFCHTFTMPRIFERARGSTNCFPYKGEKWFVVHFVSYEVPRRYSHSIVVFDEEFKLLRYSAPFLFEGKEIEYCLGLVVEDERVIMSYSTWDKSSKARVYERGYIDGLLKYQ